MYSFDNVTVSLGGKIITGFSDDATVKIARAGDAVFSKVGIDGGVAHAKNVDKSGTVVFSLFASSASLPFLRRAANKGEELSITIRDATRDTGFLLQQDHCVVQKTPDLERGKEVGKVEISVFVPNVDVQE